jgi:hypothetical protein
VIAAAGAASVVAAAGLYRFTDLFVKHYPPTPYDDVLAELVDREQAARLGTRVSDAPTPGNLAVKLRTRLKPDGLAAAAGADIAAGRMVEVDGWVLPESVALLSALAAKI